jgi:peptide/nickel transport system substrate-binding protein
LQFTLFSYTVKPQISQIATVIQEQLGQIGVKVKHEVLEHQAWLANVLKAREFQASVVPGTGGPEPNNYVMFWTSDNPINFVGINNPEFDKLIPEGQVTVEEKKRREIYNKIQEIGADEAMWMALVYVPTFASMNKKVQDYVHLPYNVSYFDTVWLAK